jgi:hypothetical protein
MREFEISETFIRKGNRSILVFFCFLVFFLLAFALYFTNFRIQKALSSLGIFVLIFGPISVIEIAILNRIFRKPKVLVDEDKLIRQCGKNQQILQWTDITRIKTVEKKNGIVVLIIIYPQKPKMAMHLSGFEEMEDLANLIKERTSDSIVYQEKRWKLDWQNPFIIVTTALVPTTVLMFVITSMGNKAVDVFAVSMAFIVSFGLLIFRPFTKYNPSGKWVELFFAILLIGIGIYALIYYFLYGKMP